MRYALLLLLAGTSLASAAEKGARDFMKKPDAWFASAEAKQTGAIILSYQADSGGWPKNTDTVSQAYTGKREDLHATFDNGATTDELRFLARLFNATKDEAYRAAFQPTASKQRAIKTLRARKLTINLSSMRLGHVAVSVKGCKSGSTPPRSPRCAGYPHNITTARRIDEAAQHE